jgi:hypothetical protein
MRSSKLAKSACVVIFLVLAVAFLRETFRHPVVAAKAIQSGAAADVPRPSKNRKVPPGYVQWHADFQSASSASQKSGKPVLLFQLMGRLDEELC